MKQPPRDEATAADPGELREQVERTRAELGRTVAALAAKTDVKARARRKGVEVREQVAVRGGQLKEQAALRAGELKVRTVGAVAVAGAAVLVWAACRRVKG
ncbi:DUF3618 domain-containing protein [Streptomyces sp. NPDC086777]|uniref:DUF3618 domain-containing protein n=1 Tax=Streptomyces sp. NPDC086777 TaxID=3154866 RepID=UPI0034501601